MKQPNPYMCFQFGDMPADIGQRKSYRAGSIERTCAAMLDVSGLERVILRGGATTLFIVAKPHLKRLTPS